MTVDIIRLKTLQKWIWKKVVTARINNDKKSWDKWVKYHKKVVALMDKEILRELQKTY